MEIVLPVSLGEALDKLTILDIKQSYISDKEDKGEVVKEFTKLQAFLKEYTLKYNYLYDILKYINLDIWNMLADFKVNEYSIDIKCKLYKIMLDKNDIRFRIKDRINKLSNSFINEKKGYIKKNCIINICGTEMNITDLKNHIKYLSFLYNEVIININDLDIDKYTFNNIIFVQSLDIFQILKEKNVNDLFTFENRYYREEEINILFGITNNNIINIFSGN